MNLFRCSSCAVLALLLTAPAAAQQRIGFLGGLNLSTYKGVDDTGEIEFSGRSVFGLGAVLDLSLREQLALRLEPMYLEKGGAFDGFFDDVPAEFRLSFAYLEVPILLKFAAKRTVLQSYFMVGPTLGLLLSSKTQVNVPLALLGVKVNTEDLINFIDFGLSIGAGLSFSSGENDIFIEGRYTHGLSNGADEGKAQAGIFDFEFPKEVEVKSRGFQILAGMTFPFGGLPVESPGVDPVAETRIPHRVGFVGGLNLANLNGVDETGQPFDFSVRSVAVGGVVLEYAFSHNLSLLCEPMYVQKGATEREIDPEDASIEERKFRVRSLDVPLLLKFAFGRHSVRPYFMAGPAFGFIRDSSVESNLPVDFSVELTADDIIKTFDFGLGLGGGLAFSIGPYVAFVEGRYTHGLSNLVEEGTATLAGVEFEIPPGLNIKSRGVQLLAGITFPLGGN